MIAVLLPVHNGMPYLPAAVESILGQDFTDFQVLVLDDASTDGSGAYLDSLMDQRITVKHLRKQSLPSLLNQGLSLIRSPYIARMDADDIAFPQRLGAQYRFLETHLDVAAVGCQAERIDEQGHATGTWSFPTDDVSFRYALLRNITPLLHPAAMMRTAAVLAVGGYQERFVVAQDRDLWWRLAARARLANLPEVYMRYRCHKQNVSNSRARSQRLVVREINIEHMCALGVLRQASDYDCYVSCALRIDQTQPNPPEYDVLVGYAETQVRVLDYLSSVGGLLPLRDTIRLEPWEKLAEWGLQRVNRQSVPGWLLLLHRLAPRRRRWRYVFGWAARYIGRRITARLPASS